MVDCALCHFRGEKLIETGLVVAALPEKPAVPGHAVVFPKSHFQILEQAPDNIVQELFEISNKLSIAMFEGLKSQGTNLVLMNGLAAGQSVPHLSVNVIPRAKDDGLSFAWPSRKLSDEQMSLIEAQVREQLIALGGDEQAEFKELEADGADEPKEAGLQHSQSMGAEDEKPRKPREDIFKRQLRRMP